MIESILAVSAEDAVSHVACPSVVSLPLPISTCG
jgi:hypothetical protein